MSAATPAPTPIALFRLPRTSYLVLVFLVLGVTPIALYGGAGESPPAKISLLTLLYLLPILAGVYIGRTATRVDAEGITVRAIFGSRRLRWAEVEGLSVTGRNVYAVIDGGAIRLPCVHQRDLTLIAAVSGGHLPELAQPLVKSAPSRRRR